MAKPKTNDKHQKKPSVKVEDLAPSKNPKGGATYNKIVLEYPPPPPKT